MWWLAVACIESNLAPLDTDAAVVAPSPAPRSKLVINEVVADNDSLISDDAGQFRDWVELYNGEDTPIALERVVLVGTDGRREDLTGTLGPGERRLIWADDAFGVDKDGDTLSLRLDGVEVDRVRTGALPGDVAFARIPDGGPFAPTWRATPGGPNPAVAGSADPTDFFFGDDRLVRLDLTISGEQLERLRLDPRSDAVASLGVGAAWFPAVGVRIKGYIGSSRTIDQKAALKINLDAYADVRVRGLEGLTLNNCVQDYTFQHESLAYDLFRAADVPAPRTGWVWLVVNGQPWGLYSHVESIDENFLARWYGDPTGHLFESTYPYDLEPGSEIFYGYPEGPDPDDRAALTAVIDALNQPATDAAIARLEAVVDLDEVLREFAIEALTTHWDGYKDNKNNYKFYVDPLTGRIQLIPWGTDQTFLGGYDAWHTAGRLAVFCRSNAGCAARYDAALEEALDTYDDLDLIDRLDRRDALLRPWAALDPRKEISIDTYDAYVDYTRYVIETYPANIRYGLND